VISRRHFLAGTGAAVLLAACSDDGGSDDDPTTTTPTTAATGGDDTTTTGGSAAGEIVLGEAFDRNAMLVAGVAQRAPFVLFQRSGGLLRFDDAPASLDFVAQPEGGDALPAITVARRGEDVDRPYYPLLTTFPSAGLWTLGTEVDGVPLESTVQVSESLTIPQIGDPLPSAPTPTTADPAGVATICTRTPACPFHEVSLDAALASGRPVAVLLSTPAYCQVGICGPVLDLLIAKAASRPELAVVHVEVYPNGPPSPTSPPTPLVTDTFGLAYEPALFVADASGAITARLDNIYDGAELAEVLAAV
jgi:hypothetical protein